MAQLIIPLQSVPNQSLSVKLEGMTYALRIYTKRGNLYIDVNINGEVMIQGRRLVTFAPIEGNLILLDTKGTSCPNWKELGTRYKLMYWGDDEQEED